MAHALAKGVAATSAYRPDSLVLMTATELSQAIHARRVSCVQVLTKYLDHIDRVNSTVNAIVSFNHAVCCSSRRSSGMV